ncbi:C6 zinc finger protein [Mollisia scopiformis]|uniref:C6 zinc finger protein n=1 Tax=Mollisia scopiformis TaxID=149040 RepID=A0A132BDQ5_MOLSC|nr:C6 zinc finger protein [Mollisia scopiformis]KUJ10546.1 C6 zinc finger protein [Mollisia scopiformis]
MTASEVDGHHGSIGPKVSRKSHRKSRNGCQNCKRRRIKCNEEKPQCNNCLKHSDKCSFLITSQVSATGPRIQYHGLDSQSASPNISNSSPSLNEGSVFGQSHMLNLMDLELLHNYNTSTAYTLSNIAALQSFFRVNIPKFAFAHPFVLHAILAMSALHLSRFKRGESQLRYQREAEHHYEIALRTATSLLPNINEDTTPALYLFGTFCSLITLASGPKPGDFLLFGDQGIAEWLIIFRGMKSILESNFDLLRHGELAPMFHISIHQIFLQPVNDEHLQSLRELITSTATDDPDLPLYLRTVDDLGRSFPASTSPGTRVTQPSPQVVFVWLYRLPDEFVELLYQRRPIPLVILSHFCVLLNDLASSWWAKGWAEHLISEIYSSLGEEYRMWMRWPMEEIGWLPS